MRDRLLRSFTHAEYAYPGRLHKSSVLVVSASSKITENLQLVKHSSKRPSHTKLSPSMLLRFTTPIMMVTWHTKLMLKLLQPIMVRQQPHICPLRTIPTLPNNNTLSQALTLPRTLEQCTAVSHRRTPHQHTTQRDMGSMARQHRAVLWRQRLRPLLMPSHQQLQAAVFREEQCPMHQHHTNTPPPDHTFQRHRTACLQQPLARNT